MPYKGEPFRFVLSTGEWVKGLNLGILTMRFEIRGTDLRIDVGGNGLGILDAGIIRQRHWPGHIRRVGSNGMGISGVGLD